MPLIVDRYVLISRHLATIKVTVHLQTDHFVEISIFRLMYRSKHELSSKKKFFQNYLMMAKKIRFFVFTRSKTFVSD